MRSPSENHTRRTSEATRPVCSGSMPSNSGQRVSRSCSMATLTTVAPPVWLRRASAGARAQLAAAHPRCRRPGAGSPPRRDRRARTPPRTPRGAVAAGGTAPLTGRSRCSGGARAAPTSRSRRRVCAPRRPADRRLPRSARGSPPSPRATRRPRRPRRAGRRWERRLRGDGSQPARQANRAPTPEGRPAEGRRAARSAQPAPAPRRAVASYTNYRDAERAVDWLSDQGFPVERVAIVGPGLRYVEQVAGRVTTGRAALIGAGQGLLIGLLFALLFGIFFTGPGFGGLLLYALVAGGIFGAIFCGVAP